MTDPEFEQILRDYLYGIGDKEQLVPLLKDKSGKIDRVKTLKLSCYNDMDIM